MSYPVSSAFTPLHILVFFFGGGNFETLHHLFVFTYKEEILRGFNLVYDVSAE